MSKKVLVVDDEPEILEVVAELMGRMGHVVTAVSTATAALELLKLPCNHYDLVISDLMMPRKNGLDFLREVRDMPGFKGQMAFMSGFADILEGDMRQLGVHMILRKPFNRQELKDFVDEAS